MPRNSEIVGRGFVVTAYVVLSSLPFVYAMARLQSVTGKTPLEAFLEFPEAYGATEALRFTLLEASASALLTVLFG
ncbi:MAG: hypothetical protein P8Q98_00245, partial [Candidatus Poseidoniaceae archaeon]|nr:hypothetical protein [Candidatus Poseidoniaceae archaeon]